MADLKLLRGQKVLIDEEDREKINALSDGNHNWYLSTNNYAVIIQGEGRTVYLHRYIMEAPKGSIVDHINGNTLDNRRSNLRIVDRKTNNRNCHANRSKSGHRGVYWSDQSKKWNAQIGVNRKSTSLGHYDSIKDALKARIEAEIKLWGSSNREGLLNG